MFFFVSEAKGPDQRLVAHVPQAIWEMYGCETTGVSSYWRWRFRLRELLWQTLSRKTIIRGVLTNGHEWIFLVLGLDADGKSGEYLESDKICVIEKDQSVSEASCWLLGLSHIG